MGEVFTSPKLFVSIRKSKYLDFHFILMVVSIGSGKGCWRACSEVNADKYLVNKTSEFFKSSEVYLIIRCYALLFAKPISCILRPLICYLGTWTWSAPWKHTVPKTLSSVSMGQTASTLYSPVTDAPLSQPSVTPPVIVAVPADSSCVT